MSDSNVVRIKKGIPEEDEGRAFVTENGGDTYLGMTPGEIDAKIAASEARSAEKFAELRGDMNTRSADILGSISALRADLSGQMQTINARVEAVEKSTAGLRGTVVGTVFGTGVGVVAILIGILALAYQMFGLGLDADSVADEAGRAAANRVIEFYRQLPSNVP